MKPFSILIIILIATIFSSCKKDFVCNCTDPSSSDVIYIFKDIKRSEARERCANQHEQWVKAVPSGSCFID